MPKSKSRVDKKSPRRRGPTPARRDVRPRSNPRQGPQVAAAPKKPSRPPRNKPAGWALVAAGLGLAIVNDAEYLDIGILPGGHNELYLILGLLICALGAYLLGAFARP